MATYAIVAGGLIKGDRLKYLADYSCFVFDVVESVDTNLTNNVTNYPVSTGSNISDHVFDENDKFTVKGFVTNSPTAKYLNQITYDDGTNRVKLAIQLLRELKESHDPFTLITEFEVLDNCVITSLNWTQDVSSGESMTFDIGLERIRKVSYATGTIDTSKLGGSSGNSSQGSKQDKAKADGASNSSTGNANKEESRLQTDGASSLDSVADAAKSAGKWVGKLFSSGSGTTN